MSGNAYNEALDGVAKIAQQGDNLSPEERKNLAIAVANLAVFLAQPDEDTDGSTSQALNK